MQGKLKVLVALGGLFVAQAATAEFSMDLGGGWEATIFDENVDLVVDYVSLEEDMLVIQKFVDFRDVNPFTGQPEPVRIAFHQVADDDLTVSRIAIADEILFNNTGLDWTSFQNVLLGPNVAFDPDASAGFDISPFTEREYNDDNSAVTFFAGVFASGASHVLGQGDGELVINVDLSDEEPVKFVLKEIPLPAPGAMAFLGLVGVLGGRRRRD